MRSGAIDAMPLPLVRALKGIGHHINVARRKRALTLQQVSERAGVSIATVRRIEKGDPSVTLGSWAMCLHALG